MTTTRPPTKQAQPRRREGFSSVRSLTETQLQIQFSVASTYDTQATGILGLDAALAAAAIAADRLLGHLWWLALIGLLLSAMCCGWALVMRLDEAGPEVEDQIRSAERLSESDLDRAIVVSLEDGMKRNDRALESKSRLVLVSILALSSTILGAIIGVLAS